MQSHDLKATVKIHKNITILRLVVESLIITYLAY